MTLALQWGEVGEDTAGMLWFDAVTAYTRNHKGQVTKHPVDAGAVITDHFVRDNPVYNISGVITNIDISTGSYLVRDLQDNRPYNSMDPVDPVSVSSTDTSVLSKFLPDSIGQFLPERTPDVSVEEQRTEVLQRVEQAFESLISGERLNEFGQYESNIQLVKLYEYKDFNISRIISNLVITSISFKEDPNSGYALYCDMTLERVQFSYLKKTQIPKDVANAIKKKSAAKSDKGKQDSTPTDESPPTDDTDGLRTPYGETVTQEFGLGSTLNTGSLQ